MATKSSPKAKKLPAIKSPKARKKVAKVMEEFKEGTLKIGKSKKTVTNPKQGIAIALSEARKVIKKKKERKHK